MNRFLFFSYGTLFLPLDNTIERGSMSLTALLVLIALFTDSSTNLPRTDRLKVIDVWFVFTIAYLSSIVIVHIATASNVKQFYPLKNKCVAPKNKNGWTYQNKLCSGCILLYLKIGFAFILLSFVCIYFAWALNL